MVAKPPRLEVVILAAGKGTRMHSSRPKVLHELGGSSLLGHVLACAQALSADAVHVVYGHGGERVPQSFTRHTVNWILQAEQLGTGHAMQQVMPALADEALVLVLYGDVPLIRLETLQQLVAAANSMRLALLTATLEDANGYGRIVRDAAGAIERIVEQKDASEQQLAIKEINTGFLAVPAPLLKPWMQKLSNDNAQGEYYLTDIVAMAVDQGIEIASCQASQQWEIMGINDKQQLATMERQYQQQQAEALMQQGVTLRDPARLDVRGEVTVGRDIEIDVNVILEGKVELGDNVSIGPNTLLRDCRIADGTQVFANSVIEQAQIGKHCRIGPFARIRPDTVIADNAHIGNFVEIKKSTIGNGSKVNHLSYIGDTTMGSGVNIGAGTITCNYDGANKHQTIIGDDVFVGSDTQLVAPVTIGDNAVIGAGSTITRDAPKGELTLSRAKQKTIEGWQRPVKKEK